jgi:hypothetical protein
VHVTKLRPIIERTGMPKPIAPKIRLAVVLFRMPFVTSFSDITEHVMLSKQLAM